MSPQSPEVRPSIHPTSHNLPDLQLDIVSAPVTKMRDWAQDKSSLPNLAKSSWNTKNLGSRIASDAIAAGSAGILVAPIITIIDKAIIENASNKATITQSASASLKALLLRPHAFLFSRPFGLIFMLYTGTYFSANSLDTITSTVTRPLASSRQASEGQDHYSAAHTTSGTAKFAATSATNLSLCVYKDNQFTKLFGSGTSARPVPGISLGLFAVRDMMTIFASFNMPAIIAPRLPLTDSMKQYVSQASAAQFLAPAAVQVVSTPLHLLGLDLYNRPGATQAERVAKVVRDWGTSCAARMCRIIPAFGVGGVVNSTDRNRSLLCGWTCIACWNCARVTIEKHPEETTLHPFPAPTGTMDSKNKQEVNVADSSEYGTSGKEANLDADELRLAQMGHKQELTRHFSIMSLIGLASTTTISWTGLGLGLVTEINAGGPGAVIYGFILVWILQCFLGASLAEFVSSFPVEGGMYHWIAAIAPRKATGVLSFYTGWFTVAGWIFTTASTNLIYAQNLMAMIALYHTDLTITTWQTFVVYQGLNLLTAGIVMFGNRIIPGINRFSLFYLQVAFLVIMITVAAAAPSHRDATFVFRTWINNTGWRNNAIAFITGLVNPLYSLGGLDGVTHITEEMPRPSRNAPLAIAITLAIAFVTGLAYLVALMFSVQDYAALAQTRTGVPLVELFLQATQTRGAAFALTFILWIALGPCVVSSQLSSGRVLWAFARDGAMPWSRTWSRVSSRQHMPLNAQLLVTALMAALGCLYLGSSTAFNSLLGSAVTINNLAYLVPILTNVLTRRKGLSPTAAFNMGFVKGMVVNCITVVWLIFAIVFFSFPYYRPVEVTNMNYTCVVVGGLIILLTGWWVYVGKRYTRGMLERAKEE
ncbi:hypothetical protein FH972_023819 [Carpinus fangiana]|uniref:Amino acid permease/ SLC12A domain-containing protein n=1 Tax=Carpinus fangiana TaxID=176857 RepID=A0A5N6KWN9_9ROSI|nr:hypothetical protein FH972_023819 [Carpinus fangiana]